MSLNKVILIGNVGNTPELRATQDGREIANFSLATSESWKDKNTGERKDKTEWHRIVIFSQGLVNVVKNYIKKGSKLYIEGQLQTRKWTDKNGVEKYTTEVVMQNFNSNLIMLDSRSDGDGGYSSVPPEKRNQVVSMGVGDFMKKDFSKSAHDKAFDQVEQAFTEEVDDDIPF